jgi:hypothetical protein
LAWTGYKYAYVDNRAEPLILESAAVTSAAVQFDITDPDFQLFTSNGTFEEREACQKVSYP